MYEEHFGRAYGFYRPYLCSGIYRYLDYGGLHNGLCPGPMGEVRYEYLLAFLVQAPPFLSPPAPKASGRVWRMGPRPFGAIFFTGDQPTEKEILFSFFT